MAEPTLSIPSGVEVASPITEAHRGILTPEALRFLAKLEREFGPRRLRLLQDRAQRQKLIDAGQWPDFLPSTRAVREGDSRELGCKDRAPWGIAGTGWLVRRLLLLRSIDDRGARNAAKETQRGRQGRTRVPTFDPSVPRVLSRFRV